MRIEKMVREPSVCFSSLVVRDPEPQTSDGLSVLTIKKKAALEYPVPYQLGHRCMPKTGAIHTLDQSVFILLSPPLDSRKMT